MYSPALRYLEEGVLLSFDAILHGEYLLYQIIVYNEQFSPPDYNLRRAIPKTLRLQ